MTTTLLPDCGIWTTDMEGERIIGFTSEQFLSVWQARADLEAENQRLRKALKLLVEAAPTSLRCEDFHHPSRDRHGIGGHCGPKARYVTALNSAIAALENTK